MRKSILLVMAIILLSSSLYSQQLKSGEIQAQIDTVDKKILMYEQAIKSLQDSLAYYNAIKPELETKKKEALTEEVWISLNEAIEKHPTAKMKDRSYLFFYESITSRTVRKVRKGAKMLITKRSKNKKFYSVSMGRQSGYVPVGHVITAEILLKLEKELEELEIAGYGKSESSFNPTVRSATRSYSSPSRSYRSSSKYKTTSSYCGARTQKGSSCRRKVKGGGRCWQH